MIVRLGGSLEGLFVDTSLYRGFRFPPEVISHCVWLYHRFSLSLRDVGELMPERGIEVSYETIHQWTRRFGPACAAALRRRRPKPGDGVVKLSASGRVMVCRGRGEARW